VSTGDVGSLTIKPFGVGELGFCASGGLLGTPGKTGVLADSDISGDATTGTVENRSASAATKFKILCCIMFSPGSKIG
jgi:hypothetical protein